MRTESEETGWLTMVDGLALPLGSDGSATPFSFLVF